MRITLYVEHSNWNTFTSTIWNSISEHIKYTDKLVFLSSKRDIDPNEMKKFIQTFPSVEFFFYENIGSDFGKYYHYIISHKEELETYDELVLTNDSVDVIRPLDKVYSRAKESTGEYIGAIDAYTIHYSMKDIDGRHIQSRRLLARGKAKQILIDQIMSKGIFLDHHDVIIYYEFGLSRAMRERGIKTDTYIKSSDLMHKYGLKRVKDELVKHRSMMVENKGGEFNPTFFYYDYLRKEEFPFAKNSHAKHGFEDILRNMNRFYNQKFYELNANKVR